MTSKHPWDGETNPNYTGPKPPYEFLDTNKKYTWVKGIGTMECPPRWGPQDAHWHALS
jgi:Ni,Fe-hydrogenase I large subunit